MQTYPAMLDLMGLTKAKHRVVDGKSCASYFLGGKGDKPAAQFLIGVIVHSPCSGFRGMRTTDYKLACKEDYLSFAICLI